MYHDGNRSLQDRFDSRRIADRLVDGLHRVRAEHIFPNCPRYIHRMALEEISVHAPAAGHEPPMPAWKEMDAFRDYLPR